MSITRKVIVSHGYGAGWSSWGESGKAQEMAEDTRLIEAFESGGIQALKEAANVYWPDAYKGGLGEGIRIHTVTGPYRVDEYDGNEYIITGEELWT